MLWIKHGDPLLFRSNTRQAFEPGAWNSIRVPNGIDDQFGFAVLYSGLTYEGDVCDPTLPGTYAGRPAFCLVHPRVYSESLSRRFKP